MINVKDIESSIVVIYNKHHLDVYRFLICFSGNQNDAEDLTQEVFIRVLKNLPNFNCTNNLKTWIFSIAKHVAIDHYRKRKFATIFREGFFKQLESNNKKPDEEYEINEMKELVHDAISKLKPSYRAVVILRGINEFSIKETSDILKCSESKVKVDYHRALKILKNQLHFATEEVLTNAK
ncbi:RNA polymerase sigma factor [Sutcliffiella horikoshii]|uniref:RNA polymerase sigma factor n=1 Tax=Sutcliffiella horikoshii TaxID=79883 RepID=A0A5D4SZI8_9BACI|nr:RNA polymerase sigma factor [Sutcliffiella horikoshii]TYS68645.1 RNA polymerase sigma factor [Sutcliffiella horikoshii]